MSLFEEDLDHSVPELDSIEECVGFCFHCGDTIYVGQNKHNVDGAMFCEDCHMAGTLSPDAYEAMINDDDLDISIEDII